MSLLSARSAAALTRPGARLLAIALLLLAVRSAPSAERANVILVIVDDLNLRLLDALPSLREKLARSGLSATLLVTSPRCCPSRASFLTGLYPHNHGVLSNNNSGRHEHGGWSAFVRHGNEARTLAVWAKAAGVRTHYSGKYLNGYGLADPDHVPEGWDDWHGLLVERHGIPFEATLNVNGTVTRLSDEYLTDALADRTTAFLAATPEPFLAVFSPYSPHGPFVPAARHRNRMASYQPPLPPSFDEADMSDKPPAVVTPRLSASQRRVIDQRTRRRAEMMLSVEEALDRFLATLETRGMRGRTYLVFVSDNGFLQGEHRVQAGKQVSYREATDVPLFVSGPDVPGGTTLGDDLLISGNDLAPTLAELLGARVPTPIDGRSFASLWRGAKPTGWRKRVLIEHFFQTGAPRSFIARSRTTKTTLHPDGSTEFYDYETDPFELESNPADERAAPLQRRLRKLSTCSGDECARLEGFSGP